MLFSRQKFIILPNSESSYIQFFIKLIKNNGGVFIEWRPNGKTIVDKNVIVLMNDSFIDSEKNMIRKDIFNRELRPWKTHDWENIVNNRMKCFDIRMVSQWIEKSQFEISQKDLVNIETQKDRNKITHGLSDNTEEVARKRLKNVPSSEGGANACDEINNKHSKEEILPEITSQVDSNKLITDALNQLAKKYKLKGDTFRSRSYRMASISISNCKFKINSGTEAQKKLPHVGPSIANKIDILLKEGTLPGLGIKTQSESDIEYFMRCHNVGIELAKKWHLFNVKSFKEASEKFPSDFINEWPILFGWSYYSDWSRKISRVECDKHLEIVRNELKLIDEHCQVEFQGSYRRGIKECGDIDLMFYKEECDDIKQLGKIIEKLGISLYEKKYVQCFLLVSNKIIGVFQDKIVNRFELAGLHKEKIKAKSDVKKLFLGVKLPDNDQKVKVSDSSSLLRESDTFMSLSDSKEESICRRMDFFLCKWSELGSARIHYTGSTDYNRDMRLIAIEKGLKFTQHGLFKDDVLMESFNERKIFELLNIKYVPPEERIDKAIRLD